jgi:hypothetical protein
MFFKYSIKLSTNFSHIIRIMMSTEYSLSAISSHIYF